MILNGANKPTAIQALAMLNVIGGGSTRIVGLQENVDECESSNTDQRIESNDRNIAYLENLLGQLDNLYRVIGDILGTVKKAVPNKTDSTGRNTSQKFRAR